MRQITTMDELEGLDPEANLVLTNHTGTDRNGIIRDGSQVRVQDGQTMVFSGLAGTPAVPTQNVRAAINGGRLWVFEGDEETNPRLERGQWYQDGRGYYIGILNVLPDNRYEYIRSNVHNRELAGTWAPETEVLDFRTHTHLTRPSYQLGAALALMVQREDQQSQDAERRGMERLRDALAEAWDHESFTEPEINEVLDKFALDHMPEETEEIVVTVDVSGYYDLPSGFRMQGEITGIEIRKTVTDGSCGCYDVSLDDVRGVVEGFEPEEITDRDCEN